MVTPQRIPTVILISPQFQTSIVYKDSPGKKHQKQHDRLQLLFIKPRQLAYGRPQLRALPATRRYLEACIYQMDLR